MLDMGHRCIPLVHNGAFPRFGIEEALVFFIVYLDRYVERHARRREKGTTQRGERSRVAETETERKGLGGFGSERKAEKRERRGFGNGAREENGAWVSG